MGAIEIVKPLPRLQFSIQINIICIGQQLVKLLLISPMGPLNLSIQLG